MALGEIDNMDQRADVFGLGAILCEILTGQPPYVGDNGTQVFRMASRGKLDDCFARLATCAADAELITMTKHCLEVEPSDRPRDAGALSEGISGYLESVETKLRETELERAAQAARVIEERKRRRVSLAAAALVLLVACIGGAIVSSKNQQLSTKNEELGRQGTELASTNEKLANTNKELADTNSAVTTANETLRRTQSELVVERDRAELSAYTATLAAGVADLERNATETLHERLKQVPVRRRGWEWRYLWAESDRSLETVLELPTTTRGYVMSFSPDGSLVAVRGRADSEAPIQIYETEGGELVQSLETHSCVNPQITISPDNHWLAFEFRAIFGVLLYDLETGKRVAKDWSDYAHFLGFSPDNQAALVTNGDEVQLRSLESWGNYQTLQIKVGVGKSGASNGTFSPDGSKLYIATKMNTQEMSGFGLVVYDLKNHETRWIPHSKWIASVDTTRDGNHFATLTENGPSRIFRAESTTPFLTDERSDRLAGTMHLFHDGQSLVLLRNNAEGSLSWRTTENNERVHRGPILRIGRFSPRFKDHTFCDQRGRHQAVRVRPILVNRT